MSISLLVMKLVNYAYEAACHTVFLIIKAKLCRHNWSCRILLCTQDCATRGFISRGRFPSQNVEPGEEKGWDARWHPLTMLHKGSATTYS